MRQLIAAFLLAAVAALVAGCSGPAKAPLVVGAIYPTSGSQAEGGSEELGGLKAALRAARESGVLAGRDVQLKVIDVETPDGAVAAVDRLIDQSGAQVIVGTYGSTLSAAAAARADQRHVVYWETGAVADEVTRGKSWVFRTVATGSNLGRTAVNFTSQVLARGMTSPTAVIVALNDAYGRSVADSEAQLAAASGINVIDRIDYDPGAYSATAIAARIAADHPQFLFDVSYIDDGIAIWDAVKRTGLPVTTVGTSSAFCMAAFGDRLGARAVGVYAADKPDQTINPAALSAGGRQLLATAEKAYAAEHGGPMTIPAIAGFVGGWALFHEVLARLSNDTSPGAIRAQALKVDVPVGDAINGGGVRFAPPGSADAGQNQLAAAVVGQWQAVGQMRVVYPGGYAVAQPIIGLK